MSTFKLTRDPDGKLNFAQLVEAIRDPQSGFGIQDRTFRGKVYRQCFVAAHAVAWITINCEGIASDNDAVAIGQMLIDKGVFSHVVDRFKPFENEFLFFRFNTLHSTHVPVVEEIVKNNDTMDSLIQKFVSVMETKVSDRKAGLKTIKACFSGDEAVDCVLLAVAGGMSLRKGP